MLSPSKIKNKLESSENLIEGLLGRVSNLGQIIYHFPNIEERKRLAFESRHQLLLTIAKLKKLTQFDIDKLSLLQSELDEWEESFFGEVGKPEISKLPKLSRKENYKEQEGKTEEIDHISSLVGRFNKYLEKMATRKGDFISFLRSAHNQESPSREYAEAIRNISVVFDHFLTELRRIDEALKEKIAIDFKKSITNIKNPYELIRHLKEWVGRAKKEHQDFLIQSAREARGASEKTKKAVVEKEAEKSVRKNLHYSEGIKKEIENFREFSTHEAQEALLRYKEVTENRHYLLKKEFEHLSDYIELLEEKWEYRRPEEADVILEKYNEDKILREQISSTLQEIFILDQKEKLRYLKDELEKSDSLILEEDDPFSDEKENVKLLWSSDDDSQFKSRKNESIEEIIKDKVFEKVSGRQNISRIDFEKQYEKYDLSSERLKEIGVDVHKNTLSSEESKRVRFLVNHWRQIKKAREIILMLINSQANISPEDAFEYFEQIKSFADDGKKQEAIVEFLRVQGDHEKEQKALMKLFDNLKNEVRDDFDLYYNQKKNWHEARFRRGYLQIRNDGGQIEIRLQKSVGVVVKFCELNQKNLKDIFGRLGIKEKPKAKGKNLRQIQDLVLDLKVG